MDSTKMSNVYDWHTWRTIELYDMILNLKAIRNDRIRKMILRGAMWII